MKKEFIGFILIICISFFLLSCSKEEPTPTVTPEPTVTVTPTPAPSPTPTKEHDPEFEKRMAEIDFLYNIVNEYTDMSEEDKDAEYQRLKNNKTFRFGLSYGYELGYSDGYGDASLEAEEEYEEEYEKIYKEAYEEGYNDAKYGYDFDDSDKYLY